MRLLDQQSVVRPEEPADASADADMALATAARLDPAAFAPLYERYVDAVFRFCVRRLGDRAAAEDATSRTFERALRGISTYRDGSFRAWLFTIARHAVADAHRAGRGDRPIESAEEIVDRAPGPEEIAAAAADAIWIRDALAALTPDQRMVVELRLAGLADLEIAQTLGRSHGSVRTAQYRALLRLRALFGLDSGPENDNDFR